MSASQPYPNLSPPPVPAPAPPSRGRGCLLAALLGLLAAGLGLAVMCCGGVYWAQRTWGVHQFEGGLRITAAARQAYERALVANSDHFLCIEEGGDRFQASFTPRLPDDDYEVFEERGIKVVVEKSILNRPEWTYLRPTLAHRGEDPTSGYVFGWADADPPSGFPQVGRP